MQAVLAVAAVLSLPCMQIASAQSEPQLLLQGRFGGSVDNHADLGTLPLVFSWPSSSVFVTFNGSSEIRATIFASTPTTASAGYYTRFVFYLDQKQISVESTTADSPAINWNATGLSTDQHNLTITKISEASYGEANLTSLTLASGGRWVHSTSSLSRMHTLAQCIATQTYTVCNRTHAPGSLDSASHVELAP